MASAQACIHAGASSAQLQLAAAGQRSSRSGLRLSRVFSGRQLATCQRAVRCAPPRSRAGRVSAQASAATESDIAVVEGPAEKVFFDGGTHFGDLALNLALGLTGIWLPITLASIFRSLYLRYRFTDRRFTILSGLSDSDRRDYPYSVVSEVRSLPRFIGEWGDITITLKDKTVIELKSVPKFREVAAYCEQMAAASPKASPRGTSGTPGEAAGKGF